MASQEPLTVPKVRANSYLEREELLVMFGFVKDKHKAEWKEKVGKFQTDGKRRHAVRALGMQKVKEWAWEERTEVTDEGFAETGFPGGSSRYHLVVEAVADNVEESYFDILERVRTHFNFPIVHKVSDYFAASENSAFFGNSQQRIGIQQDRVQQFLANIGKFVKDLFGMVRELRIIDERLAHYRSADGIELEKKDGVWIETKKHKPSPAADYALKSLWTDQVEGGTKNPQSVFGLAGQVGFTLLPDLFFNTYVENSSKVDETVDKLTFNKNVLTLLKRKLYQYMIWKEKTYQEMKMRRQFNLKYLRQHWAIIKMYMAWVKPYLRNIQRLTMNQSFLESPDIIAAFETSFIEVEFLALRPEKDGHHPAVLVTFMFRTRPDMSVRKEYQQGPNHLGRMDVSFRGYGWSPDQVDSYRRMKQREEIELLGILDSSLKDIMDALGDDFEKYLEEAGEELEAPEPPAPKKKKEIGALDPFISIFGGFKEMFEALVPLDLLKPKKSMKTKGKPGKAASDATKAASMVYHTYKKAHKMMTW